jgi:hypothetical protein
MRMVSFGYGWTSLILASLVGCSHPEVAPKNSGPSAPEYHPSEVSQVKKDNRLELVVCLREDEERRLEIFPRGEGCALRYTKMGRAADVAKSKNGVEHCKKTLDKIKTHLETAGFRCGI